MTQRISKRMSSLLLTLVTVALVAQPALAFRFIQSGTAAGVRCDAANGFAHWPVSTVGWYLNTAGVGTVYAAALDAAMASWRNVSGANHYPVLIGTAYLPFVRDGYNTVIWGNNLGCYDSCVALAVVWIQNEGQVITEADITFNSNYPWNTNGVDYDVQAVAAHEFGHALGIAHSELVSSPLPTMYAFYHGLTQRTLELDDSAALQCSQARYPIAAGPAAPATISVLPQGCEGLVDISWSTSLAATSYQLQQSTSINFSSALTIYSGSGTFLETNGFGTRYFRVRACNAEGCSAWHQSGVAAPYYPVCN